MAVAADQELHRDLAVALAPRFQPHLVSDIDATAIQEIIDGLTQVNRRLDVYLLGSNGMIKEWFMDADRRPLLDAVDPAPLDRFLAGAPAPVLAEDPARPGTARPFSVAPVSIMGEEGCYLYLTLQGEDYDAVLAMLRGPLFGRLALRAALLAFALTALVGLVMFWWLSRRLTRLRGVVAAFEEGDLGRRFPVGSDDEVGRLGFAFNAMADRIEGQVEELKRTDRLRRELVANVSHDLRSPLAAMQGYLETLQLKEDDLDPARRTRYLDGALAQSRRLAGLVGQLFELSKLDAGQVELQLEAFPLAELVQDVVVQYEAEAEAKGVALRAVLPEDGLPPVRADIGLVERVLTNLLDNALRFTPAGGSVEVRPWRANGRVQVEVADTGVGIEQDQLPQVFDRFFRADAARSDGDGAGLGLSIVQRIVELHGGTIRAESAPGEGARFTFTLPLAEPAV
ncbi:MAG: HAMP domain-containing sensor histidine kinase [Rubricoccaceae bacterium]|nr:HAMP domain-containing sensor histidine kinase [Rubricoccaceae bacterium]